MPTVRERRSLLPPWALIAAAALHLLPVLIWLWHWPMTAAPPPTTAFRVTLVRAPPKPAVVSPPAPPRARESGPDQTTEAKKTAKPEPAAPPRARAAPAPDSTRTAAATPKPAAPQGLRVLELRLPMRGDAERNQAGDPYLNDLMRRIERNRVYPPASAFNGAAERTVVYSVGVDPAGTVSTITLLASSGESLIDEAARQMIAVSTPFPHLPADLPQIRTSVVIYIPVYPPG
ncbi:MAG: TonB family protein [Stellaceae bacterium]